MRRSYLILAGVVTALAVALTVMGRLPRSDRAGRVEDAAESVPALALALEIRGGGIAPSLAQAPKDHRVRLSVTNRDAVPARLALAGYEDRITIPVIAPGATWTGEFLADRPGDDFAWLLDGVPAGRLAVTGSHLVEGHR